MSLDKQENERRNELVLLYWNFGNQHSVTSAAFMKLLIMGLLRK